MQLWSEASWWIFNGWIMLFGERARLWYWWSLIWRCDERRGEVEVKGGWRWGAVQPTTIDARKIQGTFGCKSAPYYICSIRAYFSVARFVITGSYYRGSFESVNESIVWWASIWGSRFGFVQCMIDISERFEWPPLYNQASIATSYFGVVMDPPQPTPSLRSTLFTPLPTSHWSCSRAIPSCGNWHFSYWALWALLLGLACYRHPS